jgi:uncharacterized protein (TIGR02569 family)
VPSQPPPDHVLAAFGVADARAVPLEGGQGTSWRAASAVLKPADQSVAELDWLAGVYSQLPADGFRIARQRRAADGAVCVDGWSATDFVVGRHQSRRWPEVIAAGEPFHAALAGVARPAFLRSRSNPWTTGDRVAWGELPADQFSRVGHLPRLMGAIRPVLAASQLIHGDLGGNVLFDDALPPAVIDFAPYWRPVAFASAIVVADALVWEGADASILAAVSHIGDFGQYLVRALVYRAVTEWILAADARGNVPAAELRRETETRPDPYEPVVELACQLAATR